MPTKLTYNYIKAKFEQEGYTLLSYEYINAKNKLKYTCPKGHTHYITWGHFQNGCRCPTCAGVTKPTITFLKEVFNTAGFTLLSDHYYNGYTKLNYVCSNNHIGTITWDNFKQGKRCKKCYTENNIGAKHSKWRGGVTKNELPLYETYASQLEKYNLIHGVILDNVKYLGVGCFYCKKVFIPSRSAIRSRLASLSGKGSGEANLYCSSECKKACPIYGRHKYLKGEKLNKNDRPDQKQWATMVKERDNYTCQNCGSTEGMMIAHHIDPVINNPIESMDLDNGKTLCEICHKLVHQTIGCTLNELKC